MFWITFWIFTQLHKHVVWCVKQHVFFCKDSISWSEGSVKTNTWNDTYVVLSENIALCALRNWIWVYQAWCWFFYWTNICSVSDFPNVGGKRINWYNDGMNVCRLWFLLEADYENLNWFKYLVSCRWWSDACSTTFTFIVIWALNFCLIAMVLSQRKQNSGRSEGGCRQYQQRNHLK